MKLYLWDQAATVFYKFTASADTSVILLVMTLNSEHIRGNDFFSLLNQLNASLNI